MNTNITYGRGVGVVVATGMQTQVGQIATMINTAKETTTPLQDNLKALGKTLTIMILVIAAIVFGVGIWRQAASVPEMFLTAISLAVAAIPEAYLPLSRLFWHWARRKWPSAMLWSANCQLWKL